MNLQYQLKKEKSSQKTKLGDICEQFALHEGLSLQKPKSKSHKKIKRVNRRVEKTYQESTSRMKPKKSFKSRKIESAKQIVGYKCNKLGHYANKCRVKQQKMKQKINSLEVDDNLKQQLEKLFISEE